MLTITKRPCQIGTTINTRRELHGDEPTPACDIPILGITLDANELCSLLEEPTAHRALFDTKGGHEVPLFDQFEPFVLKDKIEDATVALDLGAELLEFEGCKLKGLTLEPMAGGLTLLSFKVQTSDEAVARAVSALVAHLDRTIEIEVRDGTRAKSKEDRQGDLPINTFGEGEESEQPRKRRRKNGHAIAH